MGLVYSALSLKAFFKIKFVASHIVVGYYCKVQCPIQATHAEPNTTGTKVETRRDLNSSTSAAGS